MRYTGLIDKYRDTLPVSDNTRIISLGEGRVSLYLSINPVYLIVLSISLVK